MAGRRSGDIRRRWELRVLVALPAVWILFAAVEGYLAIQLTLAASDTASAPGALDRVRMLVIGVGSLLGLACGASLAVAVTRPMRELLRKIQHRLRGDAAVSLTTANELRQLSNAFDDMLLSFDKFVSDTHIVDGMPLGLVVVDNEDVIVRANVEAQRQFAAYPALKGRRVSEICPPAAAHRLIDALQAVRDTGTPMEISPEILFAGEQPPHAEPAHVITLHPTTTVGEVVFAIRDLRQMATIRGQIQRVDQLAALGAHVASLAHEIGGGLMGMQMLIEALEPRDVEDRHLHDKLRAEVERAARLLAEIRMFGQASARDRVVCSLSHLVEDTLWTVEPRFADKGVTVRKHLNHGLSSVLIDRDRVVQALLNVITNAFEATPRGGTVTVSVDRAGDAALVRIANTGSCIPPEEREKIFTLFYTTKRSGSGFGLPQARRTLVDHGGDIDVSSSPEAGTEFVLRFPEAASIPDLAQPHHIPPPSASQTLGR